LQSSQLGADSSLRLGDLTLRKPHYQTGLASPVNWLRSRCDQRQFTATGVLDFWQEFAIVIASQRVGAKRRPMTDSASNPESKDSPMCTAHLRSDANAPSRNDGVGIASSLCSAQRR
jgi:hypothetical protein